MAQIVSYLCTSFVTCAVSCVLLTVLHFLVILLLVLPSSGVVAICLCLVLDDAVAVAVSSVGGINLLTAAARATAPISNGALAVGPVFISSVVFVAVPIGWNATNSLYELSGFFFCVGLALALVERRF